MSPTPQSRPRPVYLPARVIDDANPDVCEEQQ